MSSVSYSEYSTAALPDNRSASWIPVSETPVIPKLGVKPLRSAPVSEAVSQSLVIVTVELFPTVRFPKY
jgi:hypothetical protein